MAITYIDKTAPSTASLSVTDYDDSSITVKATGADALSGVAKYAFQLSTDGSSWTTKATKSSTASSYSYTYSSLSSSTTYYMRVRVYDAAGNYKTSSSVSQTTDSGVLYLYNYGDECEDVTGGWYGSVAVGWSYYSLEDTYMYGYAPYNYDYEDRKTSFGPRFYTEDAIDLSGYSSINAYIWYSYRCYSTSWTDTYTTTAVTLALQDIPTSTGVTVDTTNTTSTVSGYTTLAIDISDLDEESLVWVGCHAVYYDTQWGFASTIKVYSVWLEK